MKHFDEMTGLLYLEGQLEPERAREVSAHMTSCAECRGLVRALEGEGVWLRQALAEESESVPAHLIAPPERGAAPWGWITAFGLGGGGAFTLWSGFIEPWRAQAAQAGFTQGSFLTMLFFSGAFWKGWDAMRSLMEFLAMATLGLVVIWLLRRHWSRMTTVGVVMGTILVALALPSSASAAEVKHGNPNYTLPAGQVVKTDLIVFADFTRIDGDVNGDLIVWSRSVVVNGHVTGDVLAFAQDVRVNAPVDGNVRAWCQTLSLNSTVAKNVMSGSEFLQMDQKAQIGGTLTSGGNEIEINGQVVGDVLAGVGNFNLAGSLGHDATIRAGQLTIGPSAEIVGQTKFYGRHQPEVSPTAKLGKPIDFTITKRGPDHLSARYYWHQVLLWGASFVFGLIFLLLAPGLFVDAGNACKRFGASLGFGALFLIATPVVAIIVCLTIVGLGVGIATLFLYMIAIYAAQIFVGSWLGGRLLGPGTGFGPMLGRLALGLAILRVLRMFPYLGAWVAAIILTWGLGALVLAVYKHLRTQLSPAAA
jgi:cytoskeletal protein CcmA (bactofilin family)